MLSAFCPTRFGVRTVLKSGAAFNYWTTQSVVPFFYLCICLSVIMLIIDLLQNRLVAGVTRCHLIMVHYLCRICKCGLHAVLWSHIGTFMCRIAAVPQNFFFSSHCLCGTIFVTVYLVAWDWWVLSGLGLVGSRVKWSTVFIYFHILCLAFQLFLSYFILTVQVLRTTLMHEFHISFSHADWCLLF